MYVYIYPRGPRFSDDRTPFVAPLQMITLYHAPRQGGVGWGVGSGGVYYRSWNVDHVVDAPLQMITLYHAPRQGGVGWGVGLGGVYYRSWNVDHVVDAPLQMIINNIIVHIINYHKKTSS